MRYPTGSTGFRTDPALPRLSKRRTTGDGSRRVMDDGRLLLVNLAKGKIGGYFLAQFLAHHGGVNPSAKTISHRPVRRTRQFPSLIFDLIQPNPLPLEDNSKNSPGPGCISRTPNAGLPRRKAVKRSKDSPETREVQPPDKGIVVENRRVGELHHCRERQAV